MPPTEAGPRREVVRILEQVNRFPTIHDASFADLVNYRPRSQQPFHHWFRYREGYSLDLVNYAIQQFTRQPAIMLDPFVGSGTTLMAARQQNIPAIGFDVNPVSVLVARAKTRNYGTTDIQGIRKRIADLRHLTPQLPLAPVPGLNIIDKIFRPDVLQALLAARNIIETEADINVREFLMTGWLAILEGVSNVFKEGNGIKYRNRRRTPNGYVTIPWDEVTSSATDGFAVVSQTLTQQFAVMLTDIERAPYNIEPRIYEKSALEMKASVAPDTISLCVFSPPYCNNFNYMKIFKVELWMGGFIDTYADFRHLSRRALRSHVETQLALPAEVSLPQPLLDLVNLVRHSDLWHPKIPDAILAYFLDMQIVLANLHHTLEPGGQCYIVVGTSAYAGVVIPTDMLLADIASTMGFDVQRLIVARHLTTSPQQRGKLAGLMHYLRESVIVLHKPKTV